jgi:hypothetical protein
MMVWGQAETFSGNDNKEDKCVLDSIIGNLIA